jgi:hypothetical protein
MFLSVQDVLDKGLRYLNVDVERRMSKDGRIEKFHKHFGSSPLVLATMWYDLTVTEIPGAMLSKMEKQRGFKMFLVAHYYLWTYEKNADLLASRWDMCVSYAKGKHLWVWIGRIAQLKHKVIVWPEEWNGNNNVQIYCASIDGTDFNVWEKKHPTLTIDKDQCSKKYKHGALKYQIVLSVHNAKCVAIFGPRRGGEHDQTMLHNSGILDKLREGNLVIVDRGYIDQNHKNKLAWPNIQNSPAVTNFESRTRLRQETFNGRLKFFSILKKQFSHGQEKHKIAFEAVLVIVQYQMDNGSPIFAV